MDRRTFLNSCGVAAAFGLAGCGGTSDSGGADGQTTTDDGDSAGTTTDSRPPETTTAVESDRMQTTTAVAEGASQPQVTAQSVSATKTGCGSPDGTATIEFDDDGGVVINGVLPASDPCHKPTLSTTHDEEYDDDGTLTVRVGVEAEDGMCQQCTGKIEYRARVSFTGGLPDSVTVEHGGIDDGQVAKQSR